MPETKTTLHCSGFGIQFGENIDLSDNAIDDEGAAMLVSLLMQCSVSSLSLLDNGNIITSAGWGVHDGVLLPASSSKLKSLSLGVADNHCIIVRSLTQYSTPRK